MSKKVFVLAVIALACATGLIVAALASGQVDVAKGVADVVGTVMILAYLRHWDR